MRKAAILFTAMAVVTAAPAPAQDSAPYSDRVEIRRTSYGVPHILAQDLGALGFGLAWVQLEDYGARGKGRGELYA
jgi:acyl-homoserine-lactone acylase